jgi:hypothetical protein
MNKQLMLEQVIKIDTFSLEISLFFSLNLDDIKNYLTVEESILNHVLRLLKKEMPDNVKMLTQYFQFFVNYSSIGRHEVS